MATPQGERTFLQILLALLLPPLGVFTQVGIGGHFWLNILLTLFGYLPGTIHAVWILTAHQDEGQLA